MLAASDVRKPGPRHQNKKNYAGKLTQQWKSTFSKGNTSTNGGFAMAMLVYRSVSISAHG